MAENIKILYQNKPYLTLPYLTIYFYENLLYLSIYIFLKCVYIFFFGNLSIYFFRTASCQPVVNQLSINCETLVYWSCCKLDNLKFLHLTWPKFQNSQILVHSYKGYVNIADLICCLRKKAFDIKEMAFTTVLYVFLFWNKFKLKFKIKFIQNYGQYRNKWQ